MSIACNILKLKRIGIMLLFSLSYLLNITVLQMCLYGSWVQDFNKRIFIRYSLKKKKECELLESNLILSYVSNWSRVRFIYITSICFTSSSRLFSIKLYVHYKYVYVYGKTFFQKSVLFFSVQPLISQIIGEHFNFYPSSS